MFKNYLKIAIRNLQKNKAFSLINILGFAFGISICLGIAAYLLHEYSFDQYHANSERIYRLIDAQHNSSTIDYRVKDILAANYPEIENACLFLLVPVPTAVTVHNRGAYVDNLTSADNAFFKIFTIPFISGNNEKPLPDLNSVVLTESAAKKLFGDEDPMGQEIELRHRFPLTVTGIIQDFPANSSIQPQMIVNAENDDFKFSFSCERGDDESTYRWPFKIYLLLNENADKEALIEKINMHEELLRPYEEKIGLLSLMDMYLYDSTHGSSTKRGNPGLLKLLLSIGLTILILAVINYVNLTAAQHNKRYKEIGVKKSIGANKRDILAQFLTESVMVSFVSFLIAIVFLLESVPIYRSIFYDTFHVYHLLNYWYVIIPAVIMLGIVSGCGSAYFFSSIHPIKALKGEVFIQRGRFAWRNGLTVFQFIVSIALIFCIMVMQKQIHYVKHNHPGFDEEQLLKLDLPQIQEVDKNDAFLLLDQFRQYPGIKSVSMTNGVPGWINTYMGANMPGKKKSLPIIYADSSFLQTFGIKIIKGRNPMPGDFGTTCLINESAYQYFEWIDLENKRYDNGRPGGFEVIGVVNDFHFNSLRSAIEPLCILFHNEFYPTHLSIRIAAGQIGETMRFIQKTWQEILPQYPLQYEFYNSWLDAMYREDEKIGTAIGLFAALAIVISCLGILGMAIFSTQKRTKEIGIRKVVGASVADILLMLTKHFTQWVLLANIFAWPIAWYAMNQWLQNFAYRIHMGWWMFVLAGGIALVIALLTVSWQAIRAATANPVEALRYE
ncbi:MAG: ABC transporter permease [Candidatus Hodarchaeota archaeon]